MTHPNIPQRSMLTSQIKIIFFIPKQVMLSPSSEPLLYVLASPEMDSLIICLLLKCMCIHILPPTLIKHITVFSIFLSILQGQFKSQPHLGGLCLSLQFILTFLF